MENQNTSLESKTKNISLESLVSWVAGVFFIISGFSLIFSNFLSGIFLLLAAVLIIKPSRIFIMRKLHLSLGRNVKIGIVIVLLVLVGATLDTKSNDVAITSQPVATQPAVKTNTPPSNEVVPTISKTEAEKELTEVMDLAKKAKLVSSYEFSDKASVVYIDNVWYTQKVDFKKDFLAKIATLKKAITGYNHFEVRDAYSDEKVAEVTAFTNSLEVYK
jgi:hypothetical protein